MKVKLNATTFVILVGIVAIAYGQVDGNIYFSTGAALLIWFASVVYSIRRIRDSFTFLSFNIGFFTFILGGYAISLFTNLDVGYFDDSRLRVSDEAVNHVGKCMVLCMFFVNATYLLLDAFRPKKEFLFDQSKLLSPNDRLKRILIILMIIGYICKLLLSIEDLRVVRATSFREHATAVSSYPYFVTSLSSLYFVSLFAYWGTIPNKKSTLITFMMLVLPELILLVSGERGEPISVILVVAFYIMFRNRIGNYDFYFKKWTVVVGLIALPFVIYFLQLMAYERNHLVYDKGVVEGVQDFFETQGGSVKIISNSYVMHDTIEEAGGHHFISGEIRSYVKSNIFTRLILGEKVKERTVQDAYTGDNFLRTYGYLYAPYTYNAGVGGGSTYIAEVYHDGGYLYLILFNIFIAFLLRYLDTVKIDSVVQFTICMGAFRFMPLLPREQALQWLTGTFAFQNLLFYLFIYLIYVKSKRKEPEIV